MNRIAELFQKELEKSGVWDKVFPLSVYVGDIHNHSGISYGYGKIENAIRFASVQLDFFSVTGHFAWPDMEDAEMDIPKDVVAYHKAGFEKLKRNWPHVKKVMAEAQSDCLIPFLSYEYHSFFHGDYTVLCKKLDEDLPLEPAGSEPDLRLERMLSADATQCSRFLCIPHHIGYKKGFRGINWETFNESVSPLVEICSIHGCAESMETRLKYMHTMGPRCGFNTYQGGLGKKHHFGVCGSTDHHNSAPGSYGAGRTVLFSTALTRDGIWDSLNAGRTCAAVGDPFPVMLFAGSASAGEIIHGSPSQVPFNAYVSAFDRLEKVELVQNGRVVAGRYCFEPEEESSRGFISFMFGWGKKHMPCVWDVGLHIDQGRILFVSPRLRGMDMVDPLDVPADNDGFIPRFDSNESNVNLHVVTDGNATSVTDSTQGFVCEFEASDDAVVELDVSCVWAGRRIARRFSRTIAQFRTKADTEYVDGFVSPAIEMGRFVNIGETLCHLSGVVDASKGAIYLRAYEKNGDAVYSSPVSFR